MLPSRIPLWTRLKCSRRVFHLKLELCHLKEWDFQFPRNDNGFNFARHIHCSVSMKNFHKVIRKSTDAEATKSALSHSHVKQLLQKCESIAEQIEVFNTYVKLNDEDISNRQAACQEVETVFKTYFPDSSLRLLGSSVTGLGLKGCDVDLTFQFQDKYNQNTCGDSTVVVLSNDIEEGKVPASVIPVLPPKQQLRFLRKVLIDSGMGGPSATLIPGRCPILNFTHHNLVCDLSINNKSALIGTNFMLFCNNLDKRVASLFRIITYWGKHAKFIGGPMKFKSYALFLLTMYFLQTRTPSILPPVQKILDKTELVKNQDNWSYDVCKYLEQFDTSKNSQSLEELLREFFFFYGNFDFSTVISPMISDLIDRSVFHNQEGLEECKFELNSICIQDPLNLDWNVTTEVNWKYCRLFIKGLLTACATYQEKYFNQPSDKIWGLLSLFEGQQSFDILPKRKDVTIEVPLILTTQMQLEDTKQYLENAAENVYKVFEHCLNFQCKSIDISLNQQNKNNLLSTETKQSKQVETEETLQTGNKDNFQQYSSRFLISHFICTASDTWSGRSNFQSQLFNENIKNIFEIERNISLKVSDNKRKIDKDKDFQFTCKCLGVYEQDSVKLIVNLEAIDSDVFISKLAIFLKDYIPKCIAKILKKNVINL